MAAAEKYVKNILQWDYDRQSITRTLNANKQIEQSLTTVEAREKEVAAAAKRMEVSLSEAVRGRYFDRLADEAARGERGARSLARAFAEVGATDSEIDRVTRSIERMTTASARAQRSGSNILGAADRFGTVGSQIFSGLGNSELANAAGLLGDVASAATTMNPALLGTVAAGGAVALVMGELTRQFEASKKAAEEYAKRQMTLAELVASGATSADIQERINSVQAARDVLAQQAQSLAALRDEVLQVIPNSASESAARTRQAIARATGGSDDPIFAAMNAIFKRASELTGQNIQDMSQLQLAVGALSASTTTYVSQIYDLNTLLRSGALTYNDNKAAVEGFTEAFKSGFRSGLEDVSAGIKGFFDGASEAAERASAAAADFNERYLNGLAAVTTALEAVNAARQREADLLATHVLKVALLQQAQRDKEAELWRKAGEDTQAAEAKALLDREAQARAHWKAMREIQQRAFMAQRVAIGNRDVQAFVLSKLAEADEKRREKEANEERLKAIDAALEEQKKVIVKRLEEQLREQRLASDKAIREEQDRYRREAAIAAQATYARQVELQNAEASLFQIVKTSHYAREVKEFQHQNALVATQDHAATLIENRWNKMWGTMVGGTVGGGVHPGPGPAPYTPGVAGGYNNMPSPAAAARNSGMTFNISISGSNEDAVVAAVVKEVRSSYREAVRRLV